MKALIRTGLAAVALVVLGGVAAPAAAQHASIDVRIGTPVYEYRHYRHAHRAHRHYHRWHARQYRRPVVVVAPGRYYNRHWIGHRPYAHQYLRWY